jgi:hypothetical protein
MADHQVAHVYVRGDAIIQAAAALHTLDSVTAVVSRDSQQVRTMGFEHQRTGDLVLVADRNAWFAHDWWFSDAEKPAWQFGVDIHNKPGYDPRELFFDRERKCIAQDPALVKGSHGRIDDPTRLPMLLADVPLPPPAEKGLLATAIAPWLQQLL